ncbi:NHL repeat protein [Bremerella volcania]|uniref:NHL repeat protein n=1 Tax=Bremerella volcania TaxID=2527984 RepID=A0A518CDN5_9BACT|nr:NHL repeat protein [Bremerella volcania]
MLFFSSSYLQRTFPTCFVVLLSLGLTIFLGCLPPSGPSVEPEVVWGRRGVSEGLFEKPRAVAISPDDELFIVDMTARIQVFDLDGNFRRAWQIPEFYKGRPSGLSFDNNGNLLVADTHYNRMLVYTPDGKRLDEQTIGGVEGAQPGEFGFVTEAVQDSQGNYYISEYGQHDRVQKFDPDGNFLFQWGGHGSEPGQFIRPQNMVIDENDHIWIADACNHRIQVFDATGNEAKLIKIWGEQGSEPGKLGYPYDLVLDGKGHLYVVEYSNHRVQKFDLEGNSLGTWGSSGHDPGQLNSPWALILDRFGRIHVIDSENHRVQRIRL